VDADKGVYICGGELVATGNMFDRVESSLTHGVFIFSQKQKGGQTYTLKDEAGETVVSATPSNDLKYLVVFSPNLKEGDHTLWQGETQLSGSKAAGGQMGGRPMDGGFGQQPPEGMEMPQGFQPPEGMAPPEKPNGMEPPDGMSAPGGTGKPQGGNFGVTGKKSENFVFTKGANYFTV